MQPLPPRIGEDEAKGLRLFDLIYALAMATGMGIGNGSANRVCAFDIHRSTEWTATIAICSLRISYYFCFLFFVWSLLILSDRVSVCSFEGD